MCDCAHPLSMLEYKIPECKKEVSLSFFPLMLSVTFSVALFLLSFSLLLVVVYSSILKQQQQQYQ